MSIIKNVTNAQGFSSGYSKVGYLLVFDDRVVAQVHNWRTKEAYAQSSMIPTVTDQVNVPFSVLGENALAAAEAWLVSDPSSPYVDGTLDADQSDLQKAKDAKQRQLRDRRDVLEFAGVVVDGIGPFATDASSQRLLTGAAVLAMIASSNQQPFELQWTLADLSVVMLTVPQILGASIAVGTHVSTVYAQHRVAAAAVEAATTIEEVQAVSFEPVPEAPVEEPVTP